jgi:hypothetical protein
MALLSPVLPAVDPRLQTGAYVSRGVCLYRVEGRSSSQVTLENAFTLTILATSASDVLDNYQLQRVAPV